jgi:hypothetical protein
VVLGSCDVEGWGGGYVRQGAGVGRLVWFVCLLGICRDRQIVIHNKIHTINVIVQTVQMK